MKKAILIAISFLTFTSAFAAESKIICKNAVQARSGAFSINLATDDAKNQLNEAIAQETGFTVVSAPAVSVTIKDSTVVSMCVTVSKN